MNGFLDLLKSERGIGFLALAVCSTVLAALGHVTWVDWKEFNMVTFGLYAVSKGATGVAALMSAPRMAEATRGGPASPGAEAEVDVKVRAPQAGRVRLPVLALLAAVGLVLTGSTACTKDGKQTEFGKLVGGVVDCTTPGAKGLISEFGPALETMIAGATGADGQVDWARIKDATKSFAVEAGGCVLAAAVQAALRATPVVGRGGAQPADPEAVRRGFEEIRTTQLGGKRYKTEAGEL